MFEKEWELYRKHAVPADASTIQVAETKYAFYAGAYALIQLVKRLPKSHPFNLLNEEVEVFCAAHANEGRSSAHQN